MLICLWGISSLCAAAQDGGEYHWGRDAGYFDEISGFRRRFVAGIWYVEIREPGATAKIELPCLSHKGYPLRGDRLGLSLSCKQFTTELRDLPLKQ